LIATLAENEELKMALPKEAIDRENLALAAGRCPECEQNIATTNVCAACAFDNKLDAVFCGGCGQPVAVRPMSAEQRRAHAQVHWGEDFASGLPPNLEGTDPCKHCGATFTGKSDAEVVSHLIDAHVGVFHDPARFPDATRRWHAVVDFKGGEVPKEMPKAARRIVVGGGLGTTAGVSGEAKRS
jgi:hypothetical protein